MEPSRITSPYAPDLGEVRAWLEAMIRRLRFVELVTAVVAFVARVCEVNGELQKKLAELRRRRPRSESLERLERQLVLALGDVGGVAARANTPASADSDAKPKRSRKGRHPGRSALPAYLERIEVLNPMPPDRRYCPLCGTQMTMTAGVLGDRSTKNALAGSRDRKTPWLIWMMRKAVIVRRAPALGVVLVAR